MSTSTLPIMYSSYPAISPSKYTGTLNNKVVLVTGASVGIGRAIAKAFASAGAHVAALARRSDALETLVSEIKAANGIAVAITADLSAEGVASSIIAQVEKELGAVDILINNAGITRLGPLAGEDAELETWWRVFRVNVLAPVALTRAVLPKMLERNSGVVISTSSAVATLPLPVMTAYTSSKAAITKFHESLTYELQDTGILSFAVNPGMVKTELGSPEDAFNKAQIQHPAVQAFLGGLGNAKYADAELCADTMVALAADERYKVLNGHYIDAQQELSPVVEEAEKEGKGRLGKERLYLVNIGTL